MWGIRKVLQKWLILRKNICIKKTSRHKSVKTKSITKEKQKYFVSAITYYTKV